MDAGSSGNIPGRSSRDTTFVVFRTFGIGMFRF